MILNSSKNVINIIKKIIFERMSILYSIMYVYIIFFFNGNHLFSVLMDGSESIFTFLYENIKYLSYALQYQSR